MRYIAMALIFLLSNSIYAAEFIPKKLSQMTDDLGVGTHTADTSDPHGVSMTQTNLTVGSLTVTNSLNIGTVTLSGYVKDNNGSGTGTRLTTVSIISGTASLSAATIAGVSAPYITQISGTGSGLTLSGTNIINGITAPYIAQINGTCSGNTLASPILTGNVGFGTTTPSEAIHVYEGDIELERTAQAPVINLYQNAQITGDIAQFNYRARNSVNAVTTYVGIVGQAMDNTNGSETGSLAFNIYNNGSYAERMRVRGANLGIGTTTPQTRLAVNGDISIQSSGYLNFGAGSSSSGYGIRDNSGTMQYKNNAGTWGDIPSGSSSAGWTDNGTTITETTVIDQVIIGSTTAASNQILTVVGSQTTTDLNVKNAMSLAFTGTPTIDLAIGDNDTGLEQSADNVLAMVAGGASTLVLDGTTNRVRIGTSTLNTTLQVGGTVTAGGFSGNGAGLTNVPVAFSAVTGSMSASQMTSNPSFVGTITLPIIALPATTTSISAGSDTILYTQIEAKRGTLTSLAADLILKFNNIGSSTFVDSSPNNFAVTSVSGAIGTSSSGTLGSAGLGLLANGDRVTLADNNLWTFGTGNLTVGFRFRCDYITSQRRSLVAHYGAINDSWRIVLEDPNTLKIVGIDSAATQISFSVPFTPATGTTYIFEYDRTDASGQAGHHIMIDGSQKNTTLVAGAWTGGYNDKTGNLMIGGFGDTDYESHIGMIDNVYLIKGAALHTGTYTTTSQEYLSETYVYNEYRYKIIAPNNYLIMSNISTGTYSAVGGSVTTYFPGSTSVFGLSEGTSLGTITQYSGWFDGAVRATAFNVASTEEIKENIRDIKIKPDLLDAEAEAKENYIITQKSVWITDNIDNYVYVGTETSSGTITTHVDNVAMEKAYTNYIELAWASDLNQDALIEDIQKKHEAVFWQEFKSIRPRQWNPKENLGLTREGFVVEESPDEIKGDDKQSIDPMKIVTRQQKALQAMMIAIERLGGTVTTIP